MRFTIRWRRLAIGKRIDADTVHEIVSLRCADCRRLTIGCRRHWFCGVCEDCRRRFADERLRDARLGGRSGYAIVPDHP